MIYNFEPSEIEIWLTNFVGHTLLRKYYESFIRSLAIDENDQILDFGCGSGIISKKIAQSLKSGHLTYIDVSSKWLSITKRRLRTNKNTKGYQINNFTSQFSDVRFDKIIVHYTLHDFPRIYLKPIIKQLLGHLHTTGSLIIREPIDIKHGISLYEIRQLLECFDDVMPKYQIHCNEIMGDSVEIICNFKNLIKNT